MENVFEEWNVYAGRKELVARAIDLKSIQPKARSARWDSNPGKAGLQPTAVTTVPRARINYNYRWLLKI